MHSSTPTPTPPPIRPAPPPAPAPAPAPTSPPTSTSISTSTSTPVLRYWHASEKANEPCEDRIAIMSLPSLALQLFAVFDGHGGHTAAEYLREHLCPRILQLLQRNTAMHPYRRSSGTETVDTNATPETRQIAEALEDAMREGFQALDAELLQVTREHMRALTPEQSGDSPQGKKYAGQKVGGSRKRPRTDSGLSSGCNPKYVPSARSGACAVVTGIISDKFSRQRTVVTAHVGDCRAVIVPMTKSSLSSVEPVVSTGCFPSSTTSQHNHKTKGKHDIRDHQFDEVMNGDDLGKDCVELTRDHTYESEAEVSAVMKRSRDPHPFRHSENDLRRVGPRAPPRVAGSLSVTRAFGDAYLKDPQLSWPPFAHGCPYITAQPDVKRYCATEYDRFVVLGSDGLWDVISPSSLPSTLQKICDDSETSHQGAGLGAQLMIHTLGIAAARCSMTTHTLKCMPAGTQKRQLLDDISVIIVDLDSR